MSEVCKCGHTRPRHPWNQKRCDTWITETPDDFTSGNRCPCVGWDVSVLPADGERPEFGKHRLNTPEAETAPAWPPVGEIEKKRDKAFRKSVEIAGQADVRTVPKR